MVFGQDKKLAPSEINEQDHKNYIYGAKAGFGYDQ